MAQGRRGLGRGLSALMADIHTDEATPVAHATDTGHDRMLAIERVRPNPNQPRRHFDQGELDELAASIREIGIIQPVVVRPVGENYEIVAGERRWRAAQIARLHEIPAVVRDYAEREVLQIGIVENVQRANLNPIDEAQAYLSLTESYGHSVEQVADAVGKSRSHVANLVRLLKLPADVRDMVIEGTLSAGHARALIGLENASELAARAVRQGLSVRAVEKMATAVKPATARKGRKTGAKDPDTLALEGDLSAALGMTVRITHGTSGESGMLSVAYTNLNDLDRLCQALSTVRSDQGVID